MNVLLTTAYWPNLHYFYYVLNAQKVVIEQHEHYQKQSFRNRVMILSANGVLPLSIPVEHGNGKQFTKDIQISYRENWQQQHWRAITSAYNNSPFFEFFEDDIKQFYVKRYESLIEYNTKQLATVAGLLKLKKQFFFTGEYITEPNDIVDLREKIHPKKEEITVEVQNMLATQYYQTFGDKFGFSKNLSVLDLLFNTGLGTLNYLRPSTP